MEAHQTEIRDARLFPHLFGKRRTTTRIGSHWRKTKKKRKREREREREGLSE